jgi:DNA-binding MarR family transcriptional regulator
MATLNALEELGLIGRAPDPEDGRRPIITLTAAGRARVLEDKRERHDWLAQAMDRRFTAAQMAVITEALALLSELTAE